MINTIKYFYSISFFCNNLNNNIYLKLFGKCFEYQVEKSKQIIIFKNKIYIKSKILNIVINNKLIIIK